MAFTLLIVRGEKVPLWMLTLLQQLGLVQIFSEQEIQPDEQSKYTSTILYVSGARIPQWMIKLLYMLGTVTINEETSPAVKPTTTTNVKFGDQKPPLYSHKVGVFTPSLFLRAAVRGFTHFDENREWFARIDVDKIHIYSASRKMYACLHISTFMQFFQNSGKPTFGQRIDQLLDSNIEFIHGPLAVDVREAISLLKWDQSLMAFANHS